MSKKAIGKPFQLQYVPAQGNQTDHLSGVVDGKPKAFRCFFRTKGVGSTLLAQARAGVDLGKTPLTVRRVTVERLYMGEQPIAYVYDPKTGQAADGD